MTKCIVALLLVLAGVGLLIYSGWNLYVFTDPFMDPPLRTILGTLMLALISIVSLMIGSALFHRKGFS